jgi:hypothetical protein
MDSLLLRVFTVIAASAIAPAATFAHENLTPEQLISLMKASCEQYNTISAKIKGTVYEQVADNVEPKIRIASETISRWTRARRFNKNVDTQYPDVVPGRDWSPTIIRTYVITPQWSKRLHEVPDNRSPRGIIMAGTALEQEDTAYTVYTAMWDLCGWPWDKINLETATIVHDQKNNLYIMKVKLGSSQKGPWDILYVDPSKGYIPVKKEFLKHDGTLMTRYECSDLRLVNGLWVPYRYSWFNPGVNYGGVFEVQELTINEPIPVNLLDFEFPEGTIVDDQRIGSSYTVKSVPGTAATAPPEGAAVPLQSTMTPATDEQLATAAAKAKELLKAASGGQPAAAIEVSPQFVMVTPDKLEYTLSVKAGTDPDAVGKLGSWTFEPEGLVLGSLTNLIADRGQLLANVTRQPGHTAFAKGTLRLQFTMRPQPIEVIFVSPPCGVRPEP